MPIPLRTLYSLEGPCVGADLLCRKVACGVPEDFTIKEFSKRFPDAKEWVPKFSHNLGGMLEELMELLGYEHKPGVLTMYFCIFGDKDVLKFDLEFLQNNAEKLKAARLQYVSSTGVEPHPAVLNVQAVIAVLFLVTCAHHKRPSQDPHTIRSSRK